MSEHLALFIDLAEDSEVADEVWKGDENAAKEQILNKTIEELEFSVRSFNCLKRAGINTVGDLISKSPEEMMRVRNLGKKSLVCDPCCFFSILSSPNAGASLKVVCRPCCFFSIPLMRTTA